MYNERGQVTFVTPEELDFLQNFSGLGSCNPFGPERERFERLLLGPAFVSHPEESLHELLVRDPYRRGTNFHQVLRLAEERLGAVRDRLAAGAQPDARELTLYQDAGLLMLYRRHVDGFTNLIRAAEEGGRSSVRGFYRQFRREWAHFFDIPGLRVPALFEPAHVFACLYQIQRAYHHIFRFIVGQSPASARLRAAVWDSIFTHDLRRYATTLYPRMSDMTTLITGPSGTGKELVARAIALSAYVPFDEEREVFRGSPLTSFHPLNLSALPSTLIESELFGHRRGAFTGAVGDRRGWLEQCEPGGSVFLDEIGELDPEIQVKLLRVLETRGFRALGDTADQRFRGRILAATNRDLAREVAERRFREDFYYRLCSDIIVTPSLREQLAGAPGLMDEMLRFLARRIVGEAGDELAGEVSVWIAENLGEAYPWPGNIRELEQCVRSVLIRRRYQPLQVVASGARDEAVRAFASGSFTADELLSRYCTLVYADVGSYQEVARRLEIDRRTVKSRIDPVLLSRLRGETGGSSEA
jgi:DNA-binding NtrC family response regulator